MYFPNFVFVEMKKGYHCYYYDYNNILLLLQTCMTPFLLFVLIENVKNSL